MTIEDTLASIADRLSNIKVALEQNVEAIHNSQVAREEQKSKPIAVNAVVRQPETIERDKAATGQKTQRTQDAIAVAAWAAFVAALAYAVIAQLQLGELRKQTTAVYEQFEINNANASKEAAQLFRQLTIAQQQAKAAQESANAIQRQTLISERPWLGVTVEIHNPTSGVVDTAKPGVIEVGKALEARVVIKNFGRTPTIHTRLNIRRDFVPQSSPSLSLPSFSKQNEKYFMASAIEPNEPSISDDLITNNLAQTDVNNIVTGRARIFLWGRVEFDDIFGRPHWKNFCHYMLTTGAFADCPVHNEEDTEQEAR